MTLAGIANHNKVSMLKNVLALFRGGNRMIPSIPQKQFESSLDIRAVPLGDGKFSLEKYTPVGPSGFSKDKDGKTYAEFGYGLSCWQPVKDTNDNIVIFRE
jgi:hypothetical protein